MAAVIAELWVRFSSPDVHLLPVKVKAGRRGGVCAADGGQMLRGWGGDDLLHMASAPPRAFSQRCWCKHAAGLSAAC